MVPQGGGSYCCHLPLALLFVGSFVTKNEQPYMNSSENIIRLMKSRKMKWAGHMARTEGDKIVKTFWWEVSKEKEPRRSWEDKMEYDKDYILFFFRVLVDGALIYPRPFHYWICRRMLL
jgi:hypothetical protein